jgi:molecular chaperone DnaK
MGPANTAALDAASTARGMGPATTARGIPSQDPTPASTNPMFPPAPQTYPVQAGMMPMPATRNPVVLDVTPRALGIATVAGYCEELIRRNARVPTETRKLFTTSRDDQDMVRIIVCQGESRRLDNNTVLGDLVLQGLPARPRGETQIEVTFTLDVSGLLQVSARDVASNTEQRASVDLLGAMPDEDVDAARERLQSLRR